MSFQKKNCRNNGNNNEAFVNKRALKISHFIAQLELNSTKRQKLIRNLAIAGMSRSAHITVEYDMTSDRCN